MWFLHTKINITRYFASIKNDLSKLSLKTFSNIIILHHRKIHYNSTGCKTSTLERSPYCISTHIIQYILISLLSWLIPFLIALHMVLVHGRKNTCPSCLIVHLMLLVHEKSAVETSENAQRPALQTMRFREGQEHAQTPWNATTFLDVTIGHRRSNAPVYGTRTNRVPTSEVFIHATKTPRIPPFSERGQRGALRREGSKHPEMYPTRDILEEWERRENVTQKNNSQQWPLTRSSSPEKQHWVASSKERPCRESSSAKRHSGRMRPEYS